MSTGELTTTPTDHELAVRRFGEADVQMIVHDGDMWMAGESVGTALEYPNPLQAITNLFNRHRGELSEYATQLKLSCVEGGIEKRRTVRVFNEEGVMLVTMLSKQPQAAAFRRWAVQLLKAFRHGELVMTEPKDRDQILMVCLKEAGRGNVAAIDTLTKRYGYAPDMIERQIKMSLAMRGKDMKQLSLVLEQLFGEKASSSEGGRQ